MVGADQLKKPGKPDAPMTAISFGELKPYNPTLGERIGIAAGNLAATLGIGRYGQQDALRMTEAMLGLPLFNTFFGPEPSDRQYHERQLRNSRAKAIAEFPELAQLYDRPILPPKDDPLWIKELLAATRRMKALGIPLQSARTHDPSLRDKVGYWTYDQAQALDISNPHWVMDTTKSASDFVPGLAQAQAGDDIARAVGRGSLVDLAIAGIGALPGGRKLVKGATSAGDMVSQAFKAPTDGLTWRHPISLTKLKRPIEEMSAIYTGERDLIPIDVISPEKLQRSVLVPAVGDSTQAGKWLAGLNETLFERPVNLQGGANYMRDNQHQYVWASEKSALSRFANNVRSAGQLGLPVHVLFTSMSPRALDYSRMMTNSTREQMNFAPVTRSGIAEFNAEMRMRYPDFPGVDRLSDEWIDKPGEGRTHMIQLMAKKRYQQLGFPDIASTRFALTEPELLNRRSGAAGLAIARVDPNAEIITNPKVRHPDYNSAFPGTVFGRFEKPYPREIVFYDQAGTRPAGENRAYADRAMLLGNIWQIADQQWVDRFMNFMSSPEGQKYGIGGAIAAGLLTQEQAQQLFGMREDESGHSADGSVSPES